MISDRKQVFYIIAAAWYNKCKGSLLTSGVIDSSLSFHLQKAKENGVSKTEIGEILTQLAFYSGEEYLNN